MDDTVYRDPHQSQPSSGSIFFLVFFSLIIFTLREGSRTLQVLKAIHIYKVVALRPLNFRASDG